MERPPAMTSTLPIRIGVAGAFGRMGRAIVEAARGRDDAMVAVLFDRPEFAGQTPEGFSSPFGDLAAAIAGCDVIIDFTVPQASLALARACAEAKGPALICGTTGVSEADEALLRGAGSRIAMVRTGNFSLGLNLLLGLVRQAAAALPARDWDVEVFEAHHRRKVDAPSGTALMLGEAAARGRGVSLADVSERARDGLTGPRAPGAIGFTSMRAGGVIGEHSVVFAADDEIVTFAHSARDRSLFARGALAAATWVVGRPPGVYDMMDVLGFKTDDA